MSSVVIKSIDEAAVRQAMDRYAAQLLARPDVQEVVVFGSFERGTYAPGSDLDVLIVLAAADVPPRDRSAGLRPARFPVPLDLFPFTREELEARTDTPFGRALRASSWRYKRRI